MVGDNRVATIYFFPVHVDIRWYIHRCCGNEGLGTRLMMMMMMMMMMSYISQWYWWACTPNLPGVTGL